MQAFVDLVLTQGYGTIAVEDVAARANVGRSTFYMHYRNKEALLSESLKRPSSALALIVGHDVGSDMLVPLLAHFREARAVNRVFFTDPIRAIWVRTLAGMIEPRLAAVARQARAHPVLPLPLIATQIAEAQIALVTHWLQGRAQVKPAALAESLVASTRALMTALLRTPPGATLVLPGEKLRVIRS
ncbi:MAG TPA: helix-turn-helix domain-containing protein [Rhizomicrobium sp.]